LSFRPRVFFRILVTGNSTRHQGRSQVKNVGWSHMAGEGWAYNTGFGQTPPSRVQSPGSEGKTEKKFSFGCPMEATNSPLSPHFSNWRLKLQMWGSPIPLPRKQLTGFAQFSGKRKVKVGVDTGDDWVAWLPGICQVGRLVRRPCGPPRQMFK